MNFAIISRSAECEFGLISETRSPTITEVDSLMRIDTMCNETLKDDLFAMEDYVDRSKSRTAAVCPDKMQRLNVALEDASLIGIGGV